MIEYIGLLIIVVGASWTSFIIGRREGIGYVVNIIGKHKPKFLPELDGMMVKEIDELQG